MLSDERDFVKRHLAGHWSGKQTYFNVPKEIIVIAHAESR